MLLADRTRRNRRVFPQAQSTDGSLLYASLLGGSQADAAMIALHSSGLLVLAGRTESPDFPVTPGAIGATATGAMDIFVALFDPSAKSLRYSTYLGGRGSDVVGSPVIHGDRLYLAATPPSTDFPVTNGATFQGGHESLRRRCLRRPVHARR